MSTLPKTQEEILEDFADFLGERKMALDKREREIEYKEKIFKQREDEYLKLTLK